MQKPKITLTKNKKIKYCQNPTLKNDIVDKDTYCEVKCSIQSDGINLNGRRYSIEELSKIVKKYEDEKPKKICDRCGSIYSENHINMCDYDLHEIPNSPGYAHGYQSTPYIKGFQIKSTCGSGKEIKLCDACIIELVRFIKLRSPKS